MSRSWLLLLTLVAGGCFSPNYGTGTLQCTPSSQCPSGYVCACGRCYRSGSQPQRCDGATGDMTPSSDDMAMADMTPPPPPPPTAIFINGGGGAAVDPKSKNQLNLTFPQWGSSGVTSTTSKATLSLGYFSAGAQ
jgi:hypothetical protein